MANGRAGCVIAAAVVLLALGVMTGCSGEDDEDQIRAAVEALQADFAAARVKAVCAAMSDRPKHQVGTVGHETRPTTCERDLRKLLNSISYQAFSRGRAVPNLGRNPKPEILDVEVSGDEATAHLSLRGKPLDVPFVEEDGEWKLDDLWLATGPVRRDLR